MTARSPEPAAGFRPLTVTTISAAVVLALCNAPLGHGHQHTAPWLDESSLDRGLYVEVRHPRVIRNPRSFDVSVLVNNLKGSGEVTVREVRYSLPGAFDKVVHPRRHALSTKRSSYRRYKKTLEEMELAGNRKDRAAVESLRNESQSLLRTITSGAFRDRKRVDAGFTPAGGAMNLRVEVDVVEGRGLRTIRRDVAIPIQPPLPNGSDDSWFAGDQHLHTAYSIDAFFLQGTREGVTEYADTARTIGLDWIIISDHSNVDFLVWYQPYLFEDGELQAQTYRNQNDYLVLQGQEMGAGSPGQFGEAAHLLAYPRTVDSTGFLVNPCPGLLFRIGDCEPEQVIIDRVNDNGGIAFIAHPFDSMPLFFAPWDRNSGAVGWAGLEIFNSDVGRLDPQDMRSIQWWHELLHQIPAPQDGQLAIRPDYPTRFPVGIGNSDAHQPARIGNMFSYVHLPGVVRGAGLVPREGLMSAVVEGRLVASNGPLAYGEINGAGTGGVAVVSPGQNAVTLTLETTPEFGPVSDYVIAILVNGTVRQRVWPDGASGFERKVVVQRTFSAPDKFVTIAAQRFQCSGCSSSELRFISLANPIWLEFSTPAFETLAPSSGPGGR
jgi:hypothetical protein